MANRFVDASVFVHAYIRPKRKLRPHERTLKAHARDIVTRINEGEETVTSTVHLSEVANVLEGWMSLADARTIQRGVCTRDTIRILPTAKPDVIEALALGSDTAVGTSDALAAVLMKREGLGEVYSFDKDFDRIPDIRRISA